MKKLLRISTYPTSLYPGAGLHPYFISKLSDKEIYFVSPKLDGDVFPISENIKLKRIYQCMEPSPKGKNKLKKIIHLSKRIFSLVWLNLFSVFLLIRYNIRQVHIHSPMYFGVAIINKLLGGKNLITFHGTDFYRIRNASWFKKVTSFFDYIFCVSPLMTEELSKIFSKTATFVPNGIVTERIKSDLERGNSYIAVGSLKNEKGFSFLINSYHKATQKYEGELPVLNIYGEGYLRVDLTEQINKLGLKDKVFLRGHKNKEDIENEYLQSNTFILSSNSEGFPKVLLEAFRFGCKVITTNVGACEGVVGKDYPYILEYGDEEKLAQYLIEILQDNMYDFDNLKDRVLNKYSWENVVSTYNSSLGE